MFPTVREVLALEPVRNGAPRIVAGERGLDQAVRWVHSSEVPDIATLLRGGELVLTTGIGLPADEAGLRRYIADLHEVGACGLAVEMGRRYAQRLPPAMVRTAGELGLPLVELHRGTPFVLITEAVHSMIIDAQLAELRATEEIHQRFTDLSVEGAAPAEVVAQAAALAGAPVVLENLSRQVLAHDAAGGKAELLLAGWEAHSRAIRPQGPGRTGHDAESGWLVTTVGARGQDWARLLIHVAAPQPRHVILIERAASALALGRLIDPDPAGPQRTLLHALLNHTMPVEEVVLRARALGVPLDRRHLIGLVLRPGDAPAIERALTELGAKALIGRLDQHSAAVLLTLRDPTEEPDLLRQLADRLQRRDPTLVIAAGEAVSSPREARRSLTEAAQVAEAVRHPVVGVVRLTDVGLPGLLHMLRDEPRLQTFVERELGPLLAHDARHPRDQLLNVLRAYLDCGRNKSAAAEHSHLSRPAFYERLAKIAKILNTDLDAVPTCLSLHVALLALDALRT